MPLITSNVSPWRKVSSIPELPLVEYFTNKVSDSESEPYSAANIFATTPEVIPCNCCPTNFLISYFWNTILSSTLTATSETEDNLT